MIQNFFTDEITITRYTGSTYNKGRWVKGLSADTTIKASVQPITGNDTLYLPEGRSERDAYTLYTIDEIKGQDEQQTGDILTIRGLKYEVLNVKKWSNTRSDHYEVVCVNIRDEGNR